MESELRDWQEIFQVAPIGYLQVNADNQILWCNAQAQQLLNITDWQANRLRLFLEVVRSYELDKLVDRTRESQAAQELEWYFYPSYIDRPVDYLAKTLKASTVVLPERSVGIFLENLQPIVVMRQTKERWTTDLAHELRTPLTSVRLLAETIQGQLEPPLDQSSHRMIQEIDRLAKLVQDFLDLSQIEETPNQYAQQSLVNLSESIDRAWQGLEPLASKNAVALLQKGDAGIQLRADPSRLIQVFINLFDNALKHSPQGGLIQLNIHSHPAMVEIDLIDEGCGFGAADIPYVFDRLFRGDPSRHHASNTTSITTGNGLGLAIVKQIISAHSGRVTAQNHPQTGGGWIKIELPINLN
jgi:two-component system phosphate regulon sensor histidine kinase PhoR